MRFPWLRTRRLLAVISIVALITIFVGLKLQKYTMCGCGPTDVPSRPARTGARTDLFEIGKMVANIRQGAIAGTETKQKLDELLSKIQGLVHSKIETGLQPNKTESKILDVCPEVYNGRTTADHALGGRDGFPLFLDEEGWEFDKCSNAHPLEKVVTLLLNGLHYSKDGVEKLLKQIRHYYPKLKVMVATKHTLDQDANTEIVSSDFKNSERAWQALVSKVNTKYTVVLKDVYRFTNYSRIERLVDVAFRHDIPIVGGSSVGFNGHWWNNCYQVYMKLYELRYIYGYQSSKDSCIYCEYMAGPFLGRTEILKNFLGNIKEEDDFLFHRMFFNMKRNHIVGVVCPDTMFHVDDIVIEKAYDKRYWLPLARSYTITKIVGFPKVSEYECNELSIKCPLRRKGMAEPPCCLKTMSKCIEKAAQLADERNVVMEIVCGSLLGVLKMNGVMPWDLDTDIHYYKGNQSETDTWNPKLEPLGCKLLPTYDNGNERKMKANNWNTDFTPKPMLSSLNYVRRTGYNTTRVLYETTWIKSPPSPSLNIRNVYRSEVYKHVPHPMHGGAYIFSTGSFSPCPEPGHHACLDQFWADGNLPYSYYRPTEH